MGIWPIGARCPYAGLYGRRLKNSIMIFLHGEVALFNLFVLFQLRNASLIFYGPVIHDVSPVCMLESKFRVLLGEKNGHSYLQSPIFIFYFLIKPFIAPSPALVFFYPTIPFPLYEKI